MNQLPKEILFIILDQISVKFRRISKLWLEVIERRLIKCDNCPKKVLVKNIIYCRDHVLCDWCKSEHYYGCKTICGYCKDELLYDDKDVWCKYCNKYFHHPSWKCFILHSCDVECYVHIDEFAYNRCLECKKYYCEKCSETNTCLICDQLKIISDIRMILG